jgi:excisionase family DNA binding protein
MSNGTSPKHKSDIVGKSISTTTAQSSLFAALEQALEKEAPANCPALLGELERLKGVLWATLLFGRASERHQSANTTEPEQLLTIPQVAKLLEIPTAYCYDLARRGVLPSSRVGKKYVRVRPSRLAQWLELRSETSRVDNGIYKMYSSNGCDDRIRATKTAEASGADTGRLSQAARRNGEHGGTLGAKRSRHPGATSSSDPAANKG